MSGSAENSALARGSEGKQGQILEGQSCSRVCRIGFITVSRGVCKELSKGEGHRPQPVRMHYKLNAGVDPLPPRIF